jgi:small subunit ribosomal protein S3
MGQKVNPTGIRLGIVKDHTSVWYAERGAYADKLNNDLEVRRFLEERLKNASVSRSLSSVRRTTPVSPFTLPVRAS